MAGSASFIPLEGGCACSHVRYRLEAAPIVVHACHCRFCQRMSGSAFGVNAMVEADRVTLLTEGRPEIVHTPSARPEGQAFHRCPRCRVSVWSNHALLGEAIAIVMVGTLDEAGRIVPDVHCYTATRHPWVVLPAGVPAYEGDYDHEQVWSAEAKERIGRALAG
ncbi:GFA family protein [Marinivivus vitaminiproducens]|uniref:GFA family protein n=1 Tax=Marinivivus vitaminiproducens TaxID=3035935 RepID=UPI0027A029EF|nr:GFA family protein [Geminicoccaceae bacterium SCSIO 64248]